MNAFAPKRIVAATDLSPASAPAVAAAVRIAEAYGAALEVVLAEPANAPLEFTPGQTRALEDEHQRNLRALERELRAWARGRVPGGTALQVTGGEPADVILQRAEGAELIVLGTHGRRGLSRLRLGSVSESVIRRARVPVLAVKHAPGGDGTFACVRLLCPMNLTPLSQSTLRVAASLAARLGCPLTAVAAEEGEERLEERLHQACDAAAPACPGLEVVVRRGQAADQILKVARETGAGLIVIGAARRTGLPEAIFGTTTERLLREPVHSVLVVPDAMVDVDTASSTAAGSGSQVM
jgi:nucleotide-binding universal stress UspA family protein